MDDLNNPIDYNNITKEELERENENVLYLIYNTKDDIKDLDESVKLMNRDVSNTEAVVERALKKLESKKEDPRINKIINDMKREMEALGIVVENLVSHQQVVKSNLERYPTRPQPRDMDRMKPETKERYVQTWQEHHRRRADYSINIANQFKSYQERIIDSNEDIFKRKTSIEQLSKLGEAELNQIKEEEKEEQLRKSEQTEKARERLNAYWEKMRVQEELERIRELEKEESEYFKNNGMTFSIQDTNPNFKAPFESPFKEKENKPEVISDESKNLELIKDSTKKTQEDIKEIKDVVKKDKKDKDKEGAEEGGGNKNLKDNSEEVKEETRGKKMASLLKTGLSKTLTTSLKVATAPALMVLGGMHGMLKGIYNSRLMGVAKVVAIIGGILYAIDWVRVLLNRWQIDMTEDYEAFREQYGKLAPIIESLVKLYNDLGSYFKGEKSLFDGQEVTLKKLFLDVGDVLLTSLGQGMDFILERVGLFLHNMNPFNDELTLEQYRYKKAEESGLGLADVNWENQKEVQYSLMSNEAKRRSRYHSLFSSDKFKDEDGEFDLEKALSGLRRGLKDPVIGKVALDLERQARDEFGLTHKESKDFLKSDDPDNLKWIRNKLTRMQNELWDLDFYGTDMEIVQALSSTNASIIETMSKYGESNVIRVMNELGIDESSFKEMIKIELKRKVKSGGLTTMSYQAKSIGLEMKDGMFIDNLDRKSDKLDSAKVVTEDGNLSKSLMVNNQRKNEIMEGLVKPQEQKQEPNTSIVNISASQNNRTVNAHTPDAYLSLYGNKTLVK